MTLLATYIDPYGILHLADSNLSYDDGSSAGTSDKIFAIPHLNAGLSVAGSYEVRGVRMESWMPHFIGSGGGSSARTLREFAEQLGAELETEMLPEEKKLHNLVHIAGYVQEEGGCHPEFWFVRNVQGMDDKGKYVNATDNFQTSEDFWTRDYSRDNCEELFRGGNGWLYVNGFPPGRIVFVELQKRLSQVFSEIWSNPDWEFRPPEDFGEAALLRSLYLAIVGVLCALSGYGPYVIGGDIQDLRIPAPLDVVTPRPARET
ncbi:MAG: hypothetical protein M1358_10635 [Chloroflexi bacterium]|nr:hypothetical protein [Chloroflexota bacterium]